MSKGHHKLPARIPQAGEAKRGVEGHLIYLLRQANAAVRLAIDRALADQEVTLPQFSVLTMINSYPGLSSADLARLTLLTPQTVNLIVRNLETRGLIERQPDAVHGRILRLDMTESGRELALLCRHRTDLIERELNTGLTEAEAVIVRRWLVRAALHLGEGKAF